MNALDPTKPSSRQGSPSREALNRGDLSREQGTAKASSPLEMKLTSFNSTPSATLQRSTHTHTSLRTRTPLKFRDRCLSTASARLLHRRWTLAASTRTETWIIPSTRNRRTTFPKRRRRRAHSLTCKSPIRNGISSSSSNSLQKRNTILTFLEFSMKHCSQPPTSDTNIPTNTTGMKSWANNS